MLILGTERHDTITNRFGIIASLLRGKRDVSTGRPGMDIASDVPSSPATIRNFLNDLSKAGRTKKEFWQEGGNPIGCGWPSHYEYALTKKGLKFVRQQLAVWKRQPWCDKEAADQIASLLNPKKHGSPG